MHGNNDGLKRLFNYYRIKRRLQQPIAAQVCPVCIEPTCQHTYTHVDTDTAKELLDWWIGVIEMELRHDTTVIDLVPRLVQLAELPTNYKTIFVNGVLGTRYNGKLYLSDGDVLDVPGQGTQYGTYNIEMGFQAFATFNDGYISPVPYINNGVRALHIPNDAKIPCYKWGVQWAQA